MALTHVGCEVRVRLPRWDHHVVDRLDTAGIYAPGAPEGYVGAPLEVALTVPAESDEDARVLVMRALRGWTVLLPLDFATA